MCAIFKSAQLVHPFGPQQLAHQIDQARAANAFGRNIADDAEIETRHRH